MAKRGLCRVLGGLFVATAACAGAADQELIELETYLDGSRDASALERSELGLTFAREVTRQSGYARSGIEASELDSRPLIVTRDESGVERPIDVGRWLDSGDIDESGAFRPCLATDCVRIQLSEEQRTALAQASDPSCIEQRAVRVAGAALRLAPDGSDVVFTAPGSHAIRLLARERRVEINVRLVELAACEAAPIVPSGAAVPSAGERAEPELQPMAAPPESGDAPRLKSHEPPPGTSQSEDDCDCDDDLFDCDNKGKGGSGGSSGSGGSGGSGGSSTNCSDCTVRGGTGRCPLGHRRLPIPEIFAGLAIVLLVRRGARRRAAIAGPLALLLMLTTASQAAAQEEQVRVDVNGFAPDAYIAVDGQVVGQGKWSGSVAPGRHLVQVYRPGGPAYDFPIDAAAGRPITLPPPPPPATPVAAAPEAPPAPVRSKLRWTKGPYVLAQIGFVVPTAAPEGFDYPVTEDEDTGETHHGTGIGFMLGANAGYRLARWFGIGGLLAYTRAGGEGEVTQLELTSGGTTSHTGPADLTIQSVRLGPHARFMAGGDRVRFVGGLTLGVQYTWVDLEHVDLVVSGGSIVERGTFHHDYAGFGPYSGIDLGAEFNPGDRLLLGGAFEMFIDSSGRISDDPFDGTPIGYFGMSFRIGFHDWSAD